MKEMKTYLAPRGERFYLRSRYLLEPYSVELDLYLDLEDPLEIPTTTKQ